MADDFEYTYPVSAWRPIHVAYLHAMEQAGTTAEQVDRMRACFGDALVAHDVERRPNWRDATIDDTWHVLTFDANKVRPSHAHGYGYHNGFIVHVSNARDHGNYSTVPYVVRHVERYDNQVRA